MSTKPGISLSKCLNSNFLQLGTFFNKKGFFVNHDEKLWTFMDMVMNYQKVVEYPKMSTISQYMSAINACMLATFSMSESYCQYLDYNAITL